MAVDMISPGITPTNNILYYDFMLVVLLRSIVNVTETCQVSTEGCRILRRPLRHSILDRDVKKTVAEHAIGKCMWQTAMTTIMIT